MKSQFGRGYAVCLKQFLWHEPRLGEYVRDYTKWGDEHPDLFGANRGVEMWVDGAVDHLHDLIRPRRWVTRDEWQDAKHLQDVMYAAKWGDRWSEVPLARTYDEQDMRIYLATAQRLLDAYAARAHLPTTTFENVWALDEAAGLKPQRGDAATCEGPIPLRGAL